MLHEYLTWNEGKVVISAYILEFSYTVVITFAHKNSPKYVFCSDDDFVLCQSEQLLKENFLFGHCDSP